MSEITLSTVDELRHHAERSGEPFFNKAADELEAAQNLNCGPEGTIRTLES